MQSGKKISYENKFAESHVTETCNLHAYKVNGDC